MSLSTSPSRVKTKEQRFSIERYQRIKAVGFQQRQDLRRALPLVEKAFTSREFYPPAPTRPSQTSRYRKKIRTIRGSNCSRMTDKGYPIRRDQPAADLRAISDAIIDSMEVTTAGDL
ncbi:hypothetical protein RRG08_050214 [Elysia crispata]|uniref:Uncharacterized protein n=1 Tax=Elysia crispata TaxID=231223 RepID=A0AAE0Z6X3_9GAST|nr:hypothetical protein RRG08_050214 [Elysia crispata]